MEGLCTKEGLCRPSTTPVVAQFCTSFDVDANGVLLALDFTIDRDY